MNHRFGFVSVVVVVVGLYTVSVVAIAAGNLAGEETKKVPHYGGNHGNHDHSPNPMVPSQFHCEQLYVAVSVTLSAWTQVFIKAVFLSKK